MIQICAKRLKRQQLLNRKYQTTTLYCNYITERKIEHQKYPSRGVFVQNCSENVDFTKN